MAELGLVVMAMIMVVMMMNIHLRAEDERINNSSTSATRVLVKYEEVDGGRSDVVGKLVKKLSKSRKIVKNSKKPQRSEKFVKAIGLEECLLKHQSSVNWIWRTRAFIRAVTVFQALFTVLKISLNTTFGAIIIKAKLMKLLMLSHVFSFEEPVFFNHLCIELLSMQRTFSLRYFSFGIHLGHFG